MKTNRIAVCAIIAVLLAATGTLSFADGGKPRASAHVADGSLSGVSIALDSKSYEGSTASSMPWGSSLTFKAEVYWDDGTAATGSFAAVDWSLSSQSGLASKVWTKKWIGGDGIARIKLFAPYGWTGSLTLKAVSAKDSSRSGTQAIGVTDGTGKTGTRYFSGLFGYDEFVNGRPEQWDSAKGTYSMTLGPVPDDIQQNPKALPGTFRWVAYVDDSSPGIEYKANSTITLAVDRYESCGIAANVDVRHDPLVPPPPVRYYKHISGV
ncbi:MAG: hypothetical protein LBG50_01140, partial [Clostridiales Family XIII bacterium]|nr:hypothetical protein [Clostridiales Family XIII bacterium]